MTAVNKVNKGTSGTTELDNLNTGSCVLRAVCNSFRAILPCFSLWQIYSVLNSDGWESGVSLLHWQPKPT